MEDEKIIDLYWKRDEEALKQTNLKYGPFCFRIADNILKNAEDAEECVNDTWFKAWMVMPPKRPEFLQAFLGKITRNLSLDLFRRKHARRRGGKTVEVLFDELEECISDRSSTDAQTDSIVIADAVSRFLQEISHDARIIFVRRYWYADSVGQIAERYGIGESRVKSVLMRTRNRLKAFLEKEGITV